MHHLNIAVLLVFVTAGVCASVATPQAALEPPQLPHPRAPPPPAGAAKRPAGHKAPPAKACPQEQQSGTGARALALLAVEAVEVEGVSEGIQLSPEVRVEEQDEHSVLADVRRKVALPGGPGRLDAVQKALWLPADCHHYRAAAVRWICRPPARPLNQPHSAISEMHSRFGK